MKFLENMKLNMYAAVGAVTAIASTAVAFASPPANGDIAITSEMLSPLVDGVVANIGVILPVGITLFAIILGVTMVPKIIKKFF